MAQQKNNPHLKVEALEDRNLLSGTVSFYDGQIWIEGTDENDVAEVFEYTDGGVTYIRVTIGSSSARALAPAPLPNAGKTFRESEVEQIVFYGWSGNDYFRNDSSVNSLAFCGDGSDTLIGGAGNDSLYGAYGNDTLRGGANRDELYGSSGNDELWGDSGHDLLKGGFDNDTLHGDAGRDTLKGNAGDDDLYGGDGRDTLKGGKGYDHMYGGAGVDLIDGQPVSYWKKTRRYFDGGVHR